MSNAQKSMRHPRHEVSPVIDAVLRQLDREIDASESQLARSFAEIFLAKAGTELLQERSTDQLAHVTHGAFDFLKQSRPDRVDVEVFNPEAKRFVVRCGLCSRAGFKPGVLDPGFANSLVRRVIARELQEVLEPLELNEAGHCEVCARAAND